MSTLPYSRAYADIRPDLDDPSLVGAWGMVPADNKLVDLTGNGNDGVPGKSSIVEPTILGNFRRYLPNSGAAGSALGGANAFPLGDLTVSCWVRKDPGSVSTDWIFNYFNGFGTDAWGVRFISGTSIGIYDDIDNADASLYSTAVPRGSLVHCVAQMKANENLLFINKELAGSGTYSSDNWASFSGTLYHGSRYLVSGPVAGIVSPLMIYSEAKSAEWIEREYEKGAQAIQFRTDFGVAESEENQTAWRLGGAANMSPFDIVSGTWNIGHEWIDGVLMKKVRCVAPGVVALPTTLFDATPTGAAFGGFRFWFKKAAGSDLIVGFISDSNNYSGADNGYRMQFRPAENVRLQKRVAGSSSNLFETVASYFTADVWHCCDLPRRYDGRFTVYLGNVLVDPSGGSGSNPVTDLAITTSEYMLVSAGAGDEIGYCDEHGDHDWVKYEGVWRPAA
jgi:hypothetical protein